MTWRLFFLSSTRNKNTGQVLIFRSGGDSPRGWKTARWLRRVTKGEKTLLRSWMNHIPSDVSGSRFAKTWHHFRGCPELSDLAAAEMDGVFFFFFWGFQVSSDEWKVFLYPTGQSYRTRFSTVNLLNLSSTARLNSPLKYYLVDTFSFVPFEEEGMLARQQPVFKLPKSMLSRLQPKKLQKKEPLPPLTRSMSSSSEINGSMVDWNGILHISKNERINF